MNAIIITLVLLATISIIIIVAKPSKYTHFDNPERDKELIKQRMESMTRA